MIDRIGAIKEVGSLQIYSLCNMSRESTSRALFNDGFFLSLLFNEVETEDHHEFTMSRESTSYALFDDVFSLSDLFDEVEAEDHHEFPMSSESTSSALSEDGFSFSDLFDEIEAEDHHEFPMSSESTSSALSEDGFSLSSLFDEVEAEDHHDESPMSDAVEDGESSSQTMCDICLENKEGDEMFRNELCLHSFCSDCISKYVATKIQGSMNIVVPCPGLGCRGVLELDTCREKVSREVVDSWDKMVCESLVPDSNKFYCPFKDCNAMLVNESDEDVMIREAECPMCHRLFCAQCYVPWHPGTECEEFQRLNEDERGREDLMVRVLAKEKMWKRCPHCKYYVEKTEGCLHMNCRCGHQFCYACGATWCNNHGACQPQ